MPPASRTAIPTAPAAANDPPTRDTSLAELFQRVDLGIEKALLKFKEEFLREFNNRAGYHHHPQCEEPTTKKHRAKTTTDEPEQPHESVDDSISKLIEFNEQKLEQQEYPDVVVDDSEYPMVLNENQAVATTSMTTMGTRKVEKSLRLDWQDLVRSASPRTSHRTTVGTEPAGTIGSHLYHPRYGEKPRYLNLDASNRDMASAATTKKCEEEPEQHHERIRMKNDGEFNAEQPDEIIRTTSDGELHAESTGTTKDEELHAESVGTTNDGELHAESSGTAKDGELHVENIGTTNDGELQAEKHQRLTAGTTASGALNALHLKKGVIRALNLWFASDRCYEDEVRDGIG
jgi:hypothetical protein